MQFLADQRRAGVTAVLALAGGLAALFASGALAAGHIAAATPKPVVIQDDEDAVDGAPDITRLSFGLSSDRRFRAGFTFADDVTAKSLVAKSGPPGSICVKLWTLTKPGGTNPDFLVCVTGAKDGGALLGSVLKQRPNDLPQRVGTPVVTRQSNRALVIKFSQTVVGKPVSLSFAGEATKAGCIRVSCTDAAPDLPKTATFKVRSTTTAVGG